MTDTQIMNKQDYEGFVDISRNVFAPVYPVIAEMVLKESGISEGTCLDLGSGPGGLGISVAKASALDVILLDISMKMLSAANDDIIREKLSDRVKIMHCDVHSIALPDDSVDLVVSRGSVFFWEDLPRALNEVWRVLRPGGVAWIGGGFGNPEILKTIESSMKARDKDWQPMRRRFTGDDMESRFNDTLRELNPGPWKVNRNESGLWMNFKK
ncbi:MAG: SAM-dependent methyltransferase [Candidatus Wallbacteria bacterium HGW-Wallbacteria-1]|jgi:ubiquinone/menaquinone biosynthesis C-methylase UbiE|uniref:SAM-dependent methyltransferase n=1 Tax=Candidatus Wallbacteria bacterium HGW-Wallbacteria-1 TaxID=2013854 RepID=A0A2N1PLD9_9BACT|nr:MAG: SAM-dependent methyltransferase [Candidatus Wallbacteria bacterium HGW-Wallbacteria-1]